MKNLNKQPSIIHKKIEESGMIPYANAFLEMKKRIKYDRIIKEIAQNANPFLLMSFITPK